MSFLSGIGNFFKTIGGAIKGAFTGNPLGFIGQAATLGMGLYKGITAGKQQRQKDLMDYQDSINDENYERERQDKLADYHMGLNDQKQLIKEERQYNSIGAQMNRARNAGVSPLAALGVSNGNTLASVSPPAPTSSGGVSPTSDSGPQYMSNAITLGITLKELKQRDKELKIKEDLAKQEIRESETRSILNEMQARRYDEETTARINKFLAEGNTEEARKVMIEADTALKKQEHQQKEDMFPLEKRESESRTNLNNAHANKASFEDWYQRTHHRTLSNGLSHFIDVLMDSIGGKTPVIEDAIDEVTDGEGLVKGAKKTLFSFLNKHVPYLSDQALKEYVDVLWDFLKTINFRSLR